ncbi:MAG: hypothetical protein R2795_11360 [Saprospiraceae bacterium]
MRQADLASEDLLAGLDAATRDMAKRESLRITPMMRVELAETGHDDNFDITSGSSPEQPIFPGMPTTWLFEVTAKRPGHYALQLRVVAKVIIAGYGERPFDVAVLNRAIQVVAGTIDTTEVPLVAQPIPDPYWDAADEEAVARAILVNRIDSALERMANFVQDKDAELRKMLLLLQARWSDNTNQLAEKRISAADWDLVNNQIRYAITRLLDELRKGCQQDSLAPMDWAAAKEVVK